MVEKGLVVDSFEEQLNNLIEINKNHKAQQSP